MVKSELRFRLRWNETIVGYVKTIHNSTFYSKDQYSWSGVEIEHNLKDPFLDVFDINRRAIYANDIIEFTTPHEHTYASVVFDDILNTFHLVSVDGDELISNNVANYLRETRFVWKSYVFIQNTM